MKYVKIMSLNLWGFNDWEKRFPEIIKSIKEESPDIVFFQEARKEISNFSENQVSILNKELQFPYEKFEKATIKTTKKGTPLKTPLEHGLGIISKFPFKTEVIKLKRENEDTEDRMILSAHINIEGKAQSIYNVHFSNRDNLAHLHFLETLEIAEGRKETPIIVGDYNIKNLSLYKNLYEENYKNSSDLFSYISYPDDKLSYDYFLISKNNNFIDFKCLDVYLSDHKAIVALMDLT